MQKQGGGNCPCSGGLLKGGGNNPSCGCDMQAGWPSASVLPRGGPTMQGGKRSKKTKTKTRRTTSAKRTRKHGKRCHCFMCIFKKMKH